MVDCGLVIASQNAGKRREVARIILEHTNLRIISMKQTTLIDVVEDQHTFAGNAQKKAEAFVAANRLPALADDSGLVVDALDGAPGVLSARFSGVHASDADNNALLLERLKHITQRRARFVCALHLAFPDGRSPLMAQASVEGVIMEEAEGSGGFGYDPLFFCTQINKSFGLATPEEKASVSHRGKALRFLAEQLRFL